MKAIYHTLNQFGTSSSSLVGLAAASSSSSSQKSLIGECWCPVKHLDVIHQALRRGTVRNTHTHEHLCVLWPFYTQADLASYSQWDGQRAVRLCSWE